MDTALKIIGIVIFATGAVMVYAAKPIVRKFKLADKQEYEFDSNASEADIRNYKTTKAVVSVKKTGMLTMLPGLVLILLKL